jgi:hypothetical protein
MSGGFNDSLMDLIPGLSSFIITGESHTRRFMAETARRCHAQGGGDIEQGMIIVRTNLIVESSESS